MALVIEDGSIVAGANSFVTRAEIIAYAAARGTTIANEDASDVFAILAMDYMWTLCLKGELVDPTQTTPFPRKGLIAGDEAPGFTYEIPHGVKTAQLQLAMDAANGIILTASVNPSGDLKKSKVGPIEEEFFEAQSLTLDGQPPLTVANAWLAPFLCDGGGFSLKTVRV